MGKGIRGRRNSQCNGSEKNMCLGSKEPQARWGSWGRGAERNGGGVVLDESFVVEKVNLEISFGNAKLTCFFQCPR